MFNIRHPLPRKGLDRSQRLPRASKPSQIQPPSSVLVSTSPSVLRRQYFALLHSAFSAAVPKKSSKYKKNSW